MDERTTFAEFLADLRDIVNNETEEYDPETRGELVFRGFAAHLQAKKGDMYQAALHIMKIGQVLGTTDDRLRESLERKRKDSCRKLAKENRLTAEEKAERSRDWQERLDEFRTKNPSMSFSQATERLAESLGKSGRHLRRFVTNKKNVK